MSLLRVQANRCEVCEHVWVSDAVCLSAKIQLSEPMRIPDEIGLPVRCAKCKSPYWNKPREGSSESAGIEYGTVERLRNIPDINQMPSFGKPDIEALQRICAGDIPKGGAVAELPEQGIEVDVCGYKSYNDIDGENYMCGLEKHGAKVKHGDWIKI
jgi:hypothetical protein